MRLISVFLILALALSSLSGAAFEKEVKSRHAVITISSDKTLIVGNNTLVFDVKKDSKPSTGDKITLKAFMPAMPGMPYMESKEAARELGNGKYEGVINFSMGGTWQIHIYVTPSHGKKYRVKTSVNL